MVKIKGVLFKQSFSIKANRKYTKITIIINVPVYFLILGNLLN